MVKEKPCVPVLSESSPDARSNGITPVLTSSQVTLNWEASGQALREPIGPN